MSRFRLLIVLGLLVALTSTLVAGAQTTNSKISPDLAAAPPNQPVPVIIQYYNPPSTGGGGLLGGLLGLVGGVLDVVSPPIDAILETVSPSQLDQIAADPNVKYISPDRAVGSRQAVTITAAEYTTEPINAPAVW